MKTNKITQAWDSYPTKRKVAIAAFVIYVILSVGVYQYLKAPIYPEVSMVLEMVKGMMVLAIAVSGGLTLVAKNFKATFYRVVMGGIMLQTGLLIIKWIGDDVYSAFRTNPSAANAFLVSGVITYFLMKRVWRGSMEPSTTNI